MKHLRQSRRIWVSAPVLTTTILLSGFCLLAQILNIGIKKGQLDENQKMFFKYDSGSRQAYLQPHKEDDLQATLADGSAKKVQRWDILSQAMVLPFKYRFQNGGHWEAGLSLGTATGVQWMINKKNPKSSYLGLMFYFGASQLASLDSTNSKDTTGVTRIGPSFALTGFWQITKWNSLDLEWTVGWDFDPQNQIDQWAYNHKAWISFGIGINLTGTGSPKYSSQPGQ